MTATLEQPALPFTGDPTRTCPWCGTEEANAWLLGNNHWVKPAGSPGYDWCAANGMCIAQSLTSNHVRYYARALAERDGFAFGGRPGGKFDQAKAEDVLQRAIDRARDLGVDTNALLAEVTA